MRKALITIVGVASLMAAPATAAAASATKADSGQAPTATEVATLQTEVSALQKELASVRATDALFRLELGALQAEVARGLTPPIVTYAQLSRALESADGLTPSYADCLATRVLTSDVPETEVQTVYQAAQSGTPTLAEQWNGC